MAKNPFCRIASVALQIKATGSRILGHFFFVDWGIE
jgi:hypothetical protein